MSENVKVSVIVPIYNVEKYLPRCIESLVNQTIKERYEILLVNDGSPDNSQNIIDQYSKKYPNIIIPLIKKNGGLSDARNYGLNYAKGEYISFIDSDDYVDKTFLEKMIKKAEETKSEIVICGYYGIDEINNTSRWFQKGNTELYDGTLADSPALIHLNSPYAWNKIYHRCLFERTNIRYPKGWIYEDIPTTYPLLACANRISKVDQPLIYYILKREGSITATYSPKTLQLYNSLELLINRFKELGLFDKYYDEILFLNMRHIIFRFKEFDKYRNYKLKFDILNKGFEHLNKHFKDWKENPYYFTVYDVGKPFKQRCHKSKFYWYMNIITPNFLKNIFKVPFKLLKKVKKVLDYNNVVKFTYAHYVKHCKIKENTILFESFHGKNISDSPFYMMKDLIDNYKDKKFDIYFTSQNIEEHSQLLKEYNLNIKLVKLNTIDYAKVLATSKYLVNNVSFPPYFSRRKDQKYINTWHGTPLKTLGKKMVQGIEDMSNMQRNFLHATHLLYPNDFTMAHMMEDYNLFELYSGEVIVSGYPRNSIFLNKEKDMNIRKKFGLENKEVFAYMPTWRGQQSSVASKDSYAADVKIILERIDSELSDNQVLYVNLHSLVKKNIPIDEYKHVFPFPNVDNYEFLNCCDILISDYSSVFFDFSITKKPIVLFMYDYEQYMSDRGTYFDVKSLPFEKIYNLDDLCTYLKKEDKSLINNQILSDYYNQFIVYDTIDSATKLNNYFFFNKNDNLEVYDYSNNKKIEHTLYFPPKIYRREDNVYLDKIEKMVNPMIVFDKNEFNYILREFLLNKFNDKVSYIIIKPNIAFTLFERICKFLSKYFKIINSRKFADKYFYNIAPNITFNKIINDNNSKKIKSIVSFYKK